MDKTSVLFVCTGNICRSPTAEGAFRQRVEESGLQKQILIDSAGTHGYHIGEAPDRRSTAAAAKRGYDLSAQQARQVSAEDFGRFDYILAMDRANLAHLRSVCPLQYTDKLRLFLEFSERFVEREVPDPYYGGPQGFDHVLDLVEDAASGLLKYILRHEHDLPMQEADGRR
jgi:protein-tyrosine phosphatase